MLGAHNDITQLKIVSLAVILSTGLTSALAGTPPVADNQTQCISADQVPLNQVPAAAIGSAVVIETIANNNVKQFKKIIQDNQSPAWSLIYKKGKEKLNRPIFLNQKSKPTLPQAFCH